MSNDFIELKNCRLVGDRPDEKRRLTMYVRKSTILFFTKTFDGKAIITTSSHRGLITEIDYTDLRDILNSDTK